MKRFKLLLLTLAISISTVIYAEKSDRIYDLNALSAEIEVLLRESHNEIKEGETVTMFFSISEENTIQYLAVASKDKNISHLLEQKFQDRKLDGEKWREGMIYELTLEGQRSSSACVALH